MTLQASGAISMTDINAELRRAGTQPNTLNTDEVRALADDTAGAISMSNLYSKQAVKLGGATLGTLGTNHSIVVGCGNAYAGRRLHVWIFIVGKAAGANPGGTTTLTNVNIGGVPITNMSLTGWFFDVAGTDYAAAASESAVVATGTTVTVSFNSPIQVTPYVVVAAIANANLSTFSFSSTSGTSMNMSTTVPSNGILISGTVRHNNNDIVWSGITEQFEANVGGYRVSVGWINRVAAGGPYPANITSTGSVSTAGTIDSYG